MSKYLNLDSLVVVEEAALGLGFAAAAMEVWVAVPEEGGGCGGGGGGGRRW